MRIYKSFHICAYTEAYIHAHTKAQIYRIYGGFHIYACFRICLILYTRIYTEASVYACFHLWAAFRIWVLPYTLIYTEASIYACFRIWALLYMCIYIESFGSPLVYLHIWKLLYMCIYMEYFVYVHFHICAYMKAYVYAHISRCAYTKSCVPQYMCIYGRFNI